MLSIRKKRVIKFLVCIALMLILFCSALINAAAWHDFTQSYTNNFSGVASKTSVVLHKYEKTLDGVIVPLPVANAEFTLHKFISGDWVQLGDIYATGPSGKITVEKLGTGSYKFVEIKPGYGYTYDRSGDEEIREYPFDIKQEDTLGLSLVAVNAYNRRLTSGLTVTKTVRNQDDSALTEEQLAQVFEFTVSFSNGGAYAYHVGGGSPQLLPSGGKLYLRHGESAVFDNLPVGLYYQVTETPAGNYRISSTDSTGSVEKDRVREARFINTYEEEPVIPEEILLTVAKRVLGDIPADETDREFVFYLTVNQGEPVRFTLKADETVTIKLKAGDTYSIVEEDPFLLGYIQTSVLNGGGTASLLETGITFINTYIGPVYVPVSGYKTWNHGGNDPADYPKSITVYIKAKDEIVRVLTVTEEDDWSWSVELPKYDGNGNEIIYAVDEEEVADYDKTVKGYNLINSYNPPELTTTLPSDTTTTLPSDTTTTLSSETTTTQPDDDSIIITNPSVPLGGFTTTQPDDDIVITDPSVPMANATTGTTEIPGDTPKTGQENHFVLWAVWTGASILLLTGTVWLGRRKNGYREH
ncbi:MAG: Cna B-type domain-containing protein [Oscillospiraceae bacterium]|nr:Cna B-type domain-containing protein [Oscillospiraceae bacterium]